MGWSVKTLFGLQGEAFEAERRRILDEFFMSLSPAARQKALLVQFDIDEARLTLEPAEFDSWLKQELTYKLNRLLVNYQRLKKEVDSVEQLQL